MTNHHRGTPTINFSELVSMTNQYEPHKVLKKRWHKLLLEAEVFGEPHLMRQFIVSLLDLKEYLDETQQYVTWDQLVWCSIDQSSPENWVCA